MAYALVIRIEASRGEIFGDSREWVFFVVVFVAGLIGGALAACLWRLGLFALGMLLGFFVGSFILGFSSNGTIQFDIARSLFLIVLAIVGGVAIVFLEKTLVVVATAFSGSHGVFYGVDAFVNTGFSNGIRMFVSGGGVYIANGSVYGMLAGVAVLAVIGAAYQFRDKNRMVFSERGKGRYASL